MLAAMIIQTASRTALPFLPTAMEFWQEAERLGGCQRLRKFVKLAQLVMVMVLGSVEDKRMFSDEVLPEP